MFLKRRAWEVLGENELAEKITSQSGQPDPPGSINIAILQLSSSTICGMLGIARGMTMFRGPNHLYCIHFGNKLLNLFILRGLGYYDLELKALSPLQTLKS